MSNFTKRAGVTRQAGNNKIISCVVAGWRVVLCWSGRLAPGVLGSGTGYWYRWLSGEAGALPVTVAPRTTTDYCGGEAGGLGTGPASPAQPPHRHTVTHTSPRSILHSHTTNYCRCRPLIGHSDRSCSLIGGSAQPRLSCLLRSVQS